MNISTPKRIVQATIAARVVAAQVDETQELKTTDSRS